MAIVIKKKYMVANHASRIMLQGKLFIHIQHTQMQYRHFGIKY